MPPAPGPRDRLARPASALERYSRELDATEINSSFHRHHRLSTYARWRGSVPAGFRFAVKVPRAITHDARLELAPSLPVFERFLGEIAELGDSVGPLLVQLPPSFAFDARVAHGWFAAMRERWQGAVVCEPRHASWFEARADALLADHAVARTGADPARVPAAAEPGGWPGLVYLRLHGSPRMYASAYDAAFLERTAERIRVARAARTTSELWCVFDNTAAGQALPNALALRELLDGRRPAGEAPRGGIRPS